MNIKAGLEVGFFILLVTLLPIAYKHFQIDEATGNQVMGFVIGVATSQGVMKLHRVRKSRSQEKKDQT